MYYIIGAIMNVSSTPIPVSRALKKLGRNLANARKRRRIPMQLTADRAGISRTTLHKIERGDEGVSIEAYARVLFVLGMIDRLGDLADVTFDQVGFASEGEHLPKRIRIPQKERTALAFEHEDLNSKI